MCFIFNFIIFADCAYPFFTWKNRSAMSARFNTKFMIAYIKLYKTFSCPSVSKNVYVGAYTEILLKFAIKIKFLRCSNFSLPKL